METKLISYLPPVLQNIEEFKALYGTEDYEIDDLYAALEILLKDQFVHAFVKKMGEDFKDYSWGF